jgi:hypothetical protein
MFYRGELEETILEPIRRELALAGMALLTSDEKRNLLGSLPMAQGEVADE